MVEWQLPKLHTRVRFPSPAPALSVRKPQGICPLCPRNWALEGRVCHLRPEFWSLSEVNEKTYPRRNLCASDDDGSAIDCVVGDDPAAHHDDGSGHMQCGRIPAHGCREGCGGANIDRRPHARVGTDRGAGTFCRSCAGKREAAPPAGVDSGKLLTILPRPQVKAETWNVIPAALMIDILRVATVTHPSWPAKAGHDGWGWPLLPESRSFRRLVLSIGPGQRQAHARIVQVARGPVARQDLA